MIIQYEDSRGVDIERSHWERWAEDGVNYLRQHPDEHMWYCLSGNRLVLVTNDHIDGVDHLEIHVTKIEQNGEVRGV